MKKPFGILTDISCDTIAECYDVSKEAQAELWEAMADAKPLSELICIEDSCPGDAIGLNTPAQFWGKFSDEIKEELLSFAEKQEAEFKAWYDAL